MLQKWNSHGPKSPSWFIIREWMKCYFICTSDCARGTPRSTILFFFRFLRLFCHPFSSIVSHSLYITAVFDMRLLLTSMECSLPVFGEVILDRSGNWLPLLITGILWCISLTMGNMLQKKSCMFFWSGTKKTWKGRGCLLPLFNAAYVNVEQELVLQLMILLLTKIIWKTNNSSSTGTLPVNYVPSFVYRT